MKHGIIEICKRNTTRATTDITQYPWEVDRNHSTIDRIDTALFDTYEINVKLIMSKNILVATYSYN